MDAESPAAEERPKLFHWIEAHCAGDTCRARRYAFAQLAGMSAEYVRRLCLPFSDLTRALPSDRMKTKVRLATGGEIGPGDWAPALRSAA